MWWISFKYCIWYKFIWESSMKVNSDSGDFNLAQENSLYWWFTTGLIILNIFVPKKAQWSVCIFLLATSRQFFMCASCQVWSLSLIFLPNVSYLRKMNGDWTCCVHLNERPGAFFHQNCTLSNLQKIIRSTGVRTPHQNKSKGKCRG